MAQAIMAQAFTGTKDSIQCPTMSLPVRVVLKSLLVLALVAASAHVVVSLHWIIDALSLPEINSLPQLLVGYAFLNVSTIGGYQWLFGAWVSNDLPSTITKAFPPTTSVRDGSCAICLDEFSRGSGPCRELQCKHVFHSGYIDEWWLQGRSAKLSCPTCRQIQALGRF